MGGEKSFSISSTYCATGSPPRRQGKANWHCVRRPALRITPAQAGKRTRSWRAYGCPWDHPRVGGEKVTHNTDRKSRSGSPPRGRGKGIQRVVLFITRRITPAWAGKRMSFFASSELDKDHPRVGGEKFSTVFVGFLLPGSPPRGRGKVEDMRKAGLNPRITPAWAGKS